MKKPQERLAGDLPELSVLLKVPSGKLAVANDLRRFYRVINACDMNSFSGLQKLMRSYERIGLAHGFVGNTCPSLFRTDFRHLAIGVKGDRDGRRNVNPVDGARAVAHICTDLWWYSLCDLDDLLSRSGGKVPEDVTVVSVEPGAYRVRHRYHLLDREDYRAAQVFARIDRIRA
jgi:hypothetical protein